MIKWSDQSRFRELFSMEWYVLGNGPMDYSALHPKQQPGNPAAAPAAAVDAAAGLAGSSISSKLPRKAGIATEADSAEIAHSSSSSSRSSSSTDRRTVQVLGWQYSGYPNGLPVEQESSTPSAAAAAATAAAAAAGVDAGFNTIEAGVVAATKSLFSGELDGQQFMPQRTGGCWCYICMLLMWLRCHWLTGASHISTRCLHTMTWCVPSHPCNHTAYSCWKLYVAANSCSYSVKPFPAIALSRTHALLLLQTMGRCTQARSSKHLTIDS
jgi:hypothetical protein